MYTQDLPLSGLDPISQPIASTDLVLFTQDTPDGFKSGSGTVESFLQYLLAQIAAGATGGLSDYLKKVFLTSANSGISGLGTPSNPMALNYGYLNTVYLTVTAFNAAQGVINQQFADEVTNRNLAIANLKTYTDGVVYTANQTRSNADAGITDFFNNALAGEANTRYNEDAYLQSQITSLQGICQNLQQQINSLSANNWTAQQITNLVYPLGTTIVTNTSGSSAPPQPANQLQAYPYAGWGVKGYAYDLNPVIMVRTS